MRDRIWFAQSLRGAAALIVVYHHLAVGFWVNNAAVADFAGLEPVAAAPALPHTALTRFCGSLGISGGPFGVGLFFLISGFVIPFSLERLGPRRFLVQRAFRLYPTYAAGLALTCASLALYAAAHGTPFGVRFADYWQNASLCRDAFDGFGIDGIVWTLEVELKFYLLCAALCTFTNLRSMPALVLPPLLLTLAGASVDLGHPSLRGCAGLALAAPYLPYMFIGTCFYNAQLGHWTPGKAAFAGALLAACAGVNFALFQPLVGLTPRFFAASYGLALLVFALAYRFQHRLPYSRAVDGLARISYPLYVVHSITGYVLLTVLTAAGCPPYAAIGTAMTAVTLLAIALHVGIETPSLRLGKWAGRAAPR